MNTNQIMNEQLLISTKTYISTALTDSTKHGYFMQGVDTTTLTDIYNSLTNDNVAELSKQARSIVETHLSQARHNFDIGMWKFAGGIIVVGAATMVVGKVLNYFECDPEYKVMTLGGICTVVGMILGASVGH